MRHQSASVTTDDLITTSCGQGTAPSRLAPFSVKETGPVMTTKIQQEYAQSSWDMADGLFPAEFPASHSKRSHHIDSVEFNSPDKRRRGRSPRAHHPRLLHTLHRSPILPHVTGSASPTDPHRSQHWDTLIMLFRHNRMGTALTMALTKKSALCHLMRGLKLAQRPLGHTLPNPSAPVEIKSSMAAGWNTITGPAFFQ